MSSKPQVIDNEGPSTAVAAARTQSVERASEAGAIIDMIDRAARDNTVDIDKMRELLAMRKEIKAQENEEAFRAALSEAQAKMRPIATDSRNSQTSSKYASYPALDRVLRPIYTELGFALSFNTESGAPDGFIRVVCFVSCKGHKEKYHVDMPADGKGAKGGDVMTKTHATGSALTYGQRYLLKMIFNIAVGADDDGNRAGQQKVQVSDEVADKMRETVQALVTEMKMDIEKFLKWAKAPSIADIPGADLPDIVASLQERKRKLGAKS